MCEILYLLRVEIGNIYSRSNKNPLCTAKKPIIVLAINFHLEKSGLGCTSLRVTKPPERNEILKKIQKPISCAG